MSLIKSISGIRGTIGGRPNEGLTPLDIIKFSSAYVQMIAKDKGKNRPVVVVGRDARSSGSIINQIVCATLQSMGADVIDLGLTTTPTTEIAVTALQADGGIIITASHNPSNWNALKLLNRQGEFISAHEGEEILRISEEESFIYAELVNIGQYSQNDEMLSFHIRRILGLPLVDVEAISRANFKIVVDAVNSSGGIAIPSLLRALGVKEIICLNCTPDGNFAHNPEPLPQHLGEISEAVKKHSAHLGIVVDPDVDRLAFVCENGEMFGEEYTLVAVADYVLQHKGGNTVSNLSSTRALKVITQKAGYEYFASAVGEVNVVEMMKKTQAVIGGEGNGGVIYPELHYGRDALVGVALFLSHLAHTGLTASNLRKTYPNFFMSKNKIDLPPNTDIRSILEKISEKYSSFPQNKEDGLKIEFPDEWVHLRRSNTEPIIRIYAESTLPTKADELVRRFISEIEQFIRNSSTNN